MGAGANQKLLYLEPDALGSPRVAIDPDRDVAMWRWDLTGEAFGNSAPNEDPDADNIKLTLDMRFPGQRYDAASELNYNYYRDYDPTTGRYIQSDPIGLAGGASTYGYSRQNPETNLDPLGLRDALGSFMRNYSIGQEDTNIGIASLKDFFDAIERAAGFDMTARKLTPCEKRFLSQYHQAEILDSVVIHGHMPWFVVDGFDGITLGNDIYLEADRPNTLSGISILGHEVTHVEQQRRLSFVPKYVWGSISGLISTGDRGEARDSIALEKEGIEMGRKIYSDLLKGGGNPCGCE